MTDPVKFAILTVCTGNICRSPAAALLLESLIADPRVSARSAGTGARPGMAIDPPTATLLEASGVDPTRFQSTFLTASDLDRADLVLCLTREHRSRVVTLSPRALHRVYTLREFARLVSRVSAGELGGETDPVARLRLLTDAARKHRQPVDAHADDVLDPYGRGKPASQRAYEAIETAVTTIAAAVRNTTLA